MSNLVETSRADGVLTILINRPEKKNALTQAMYVSFADALEEAADDPAIRVILIRGAGDMFSAGNDIGDFVTASANGDGLGTIPRFLRALAHAPKPLVAAVQGRGVGIGTTILLHCDYVVLAEGTLLSTPFVNLALVPEAASSLLLPARIGHVRAFSMLGLGEPIGADDALAWGLANKVVPATDLAAAAEAVAQRLARQPIGALIATKALLRAPEAIAARMEREEAEFIARLQTAEATEAFAAFAEKRPPDFSRPG